MVFVDQKGRESSTESRKRYILATESRTGPADPILTAYWEIIKKGADLLDPKSLPAPKGPLDEFTMAEKVATERFMREAGYGLSLANQRQCRLFWKRLSEMRKTGVDQILLYRTKEFDRFCKSYSSEHGESLVHMVRLWEDMYGLQIKQLESRVIQESK